MTHYRINCLSEVTRAFEETHAHEFIITIPDYPEIAEEMNNASTVVFCHFCRQCDTLRPYPLLWVKG